MSQPRKILVTSALPYANGPIHLGHMLEYIQTDIWVRFQQSIGNQCTYVCADDTHGTAIMLKAQAEGITPEALIAQVQADHEKDFADFNIGFDNYHSTNSAENKELVAHVYGLCKDNGFIASRSVTQAYDPEKEMFLADRYIKGDCPKCDTPDQYGDNCESCGATYNALELKNAKSEMSGATPIEKESEHFFFKLPEFQSMLQTWTRSGALQTQVANKLAEWVDGELREWDISRDAPYFGFEIPGEPNKFFYVWLDAPVGYMSSFKNLCDRTEGLDFDEYWGKDSDCELYHFIGKDIINFHTLFWPAMLEATDYRKPTAVWAHGYVTVNGEKMSKSRGTFIKARTYLDHLKPEYLRYYYAAKLSDTVDDFDLNLEDFQQRVNSDLVGKVVNIASRSAGFIKKAGGSLGAQLDDETMYAEFVSAGDVIKDHYEKREFSKAIRAIMALADKANEYIQDKAPWSMSKDESKADEVIAVCTQSLNLFRVLMTYLSPVLPQMSKDVCAFFNLESLAWHNIKTPLLNHEINKFKALITRIEKESIEGITEASKDSTAVEAPKPAKKAKKTKKKKEPEAPSEIQFDDFAKVDLRVAKVIKADHVEGADKLISVTLDVGELGERHVFSGIKASYQPEDLVGKSVILVANLAPRKMRFGMSEGMIIAGDNGDDIHILEAHMALAPGSKIS
jgi:methionyl-tRNA synthetase